MDKIGEANKPFEARVSDLLEVERRKKDDDEKIVVVYQPKDVEVIDTSAFIKTNMEYGLDSVFRLVDSVNLIHKSIFRKKVENQILSSRCCLVSRCLPLSAPAWLATRRCSSPLTSSLARPPSSSSTPRTLEVTSCFKPSIQTPNEFPAEGEACLDVMSDLAASNEFNLELVAVSTDSIPVHRCVIIIAI